ncbi:nitroimidazol reductase NimA-like FMN-containing flavoprotein (pyridoxamine 5'-phosphate oxidase superfamily) [Lachnospiraceae bacterium PF1-22]|uniref:pyridoxamine 5'-phosphate oxidase family protein n=1 Tax=Ohessyouella blattaphilus TaxID=2949333 RepID=UPI003E1E7F47
MRRKEREVTDLQEIREFLETQEVCRVAFVDEGAPYILPLNYGYELGEQGELTFYIHSGKLGKKMDIVKEQPYVGVELDGNHQLVTGKAGCNYTYKYFSLVGKGKVTLLEGEEKQAGLEKLMAHFTKEPVAFNEKMIGAVELLKLEVTSFACKKNA